MAADKDKPLAQQSSRASELLNELKPAVELAEKTLALIQEKGDLDAMMLMRRGRCLYHLNRDEEALLCFRTIRIKYPKATDAKPAAYSEIVIHARLRNTAEVSTLSDDYLRKYPDADNVEQVATFGGEILVQNENWKEVAIFYRDLETKFPNSPSIDRYIFLQGVALFQDGNLKEAISFLTRFKKNFPNSSNTEIATYFLALSHFQSNNYKETIAACKEYLSLFPDGAHVGDIRYRIAYIDSNDREIDQSDKIIRDLTAFLEQNPNDSMAGSMLCLIGDSYKKKKTDKSDELGKFQKLALEAYKKAAALDSSDSVLQYALDSATSILQDEKNWAAIAELHADVLKNKPESNQALLSASWVAKMKIRANNGAEATEILASVVKTRIANPINERVEPLLDELVKSLIPRKKLLEADLDPLDKQLTEILNKAVIGQENATTNARIYYARAQLANYFKRSDIADRHLRGIATINAKDPTVLSPALLAVSGDILLKEGRLDEAEGMYKRLMDRHKDGVFSDAGPVGLGNVALARKQPGEALQIFQSSLLNNPGMSRFKEANLGKLNAMVALDRLDDAKKFALEMVGDKTFRGEIAGKTHLVIGAIYRAQSKKSTEKTVKDDLLKQALSHYQKLITAYKSTPDVCAEGYWQAYETAMEQGDKTAADQFMTLLASDPKVKNTARSKQAVLLAK